MPKFAVPVYKMVRGMAVVEAKSAREAQRLAKDGVITGVSDLAGIDCNHIIDWDGVRKGKIRELKGEDLEAYMLITTVGSPFDNDYGVPYEDYEPVQILSSRRWE
jgi:hypothetical protein